MESEIRWESEENERSIVYYNIIIADENITILSLYFAIINLLFWFWWQTKCHEFQKMNRPTDRLRKTLYLYSLSFERTLHSFFFQLVIAGLCSIYTAKANFIRFVLFFLAIFRAKVCIQVPKQVQSPIY